MQYFQHHRVEIIPSAKQAHTKRKLYDMDPVEEAFPSLINKSTKTTDWPPAFVPNNSSDLGFNRMTAVISPEQSPSSTDSTQNGLDFSVETLKKYADIEKQIRNTFEFCEQILASRRDTLLNDLRLIFQDMDTDNCQNIQFVTNLYNIKSCINDMFGYISLPCVDNNALKIMAPEKSNLQPTTDALNYSFVPEKLPTAFNKQFNFKFRARMTMELKFGGNGLENNRFTEPNGISTDKDKNIVVADSNSNYMKCFKSDGTFRFKFGIEKLLFPNKVSCHKETGNFVIIERKPAHEIKIFSPEGDFIRRFGSGLLKSPRGVCIDRKSRIIILESKIMRILIFTMEGELIHYFDVSDYFRFANSICTSNTEDTIFISDNHSHCIKAFSYEGKFLRQIGGPGLTNYPTSVDVNSKNELLITDNYNCFNLTILSENGDLLRAFESKTKHTRILDVSVVDDNTIMFSSRDNFIYKYKF